MAGRRRTRLALEADRRNRGQLANLGGAVRLARLARRLTQQQLAARTDLGRMTVSRAERGLGGGLTIDAWQRIGLALGMPLVVSLQRDPLAETADAGHLAIQELVLRVGRAAGYRGLVELATKPAEPWRSIDVALIDDARRRLLVVECWNTFGDVGAAVCVSSRKQADAEAIAVARWGDEPGTVGLVWVVRATVRNRALVARYPEVFAARFPGSSAAWVAVLERGLDSPTEPGLVWASVDGGRLFPWRRRRGPGA